MNESEAVRHPDLLVGIGSMDDAGVYRLAPDVALVQSVDFFTPIVDDAYDWGRIAAANALSDLYAMGATPLTALSIVAWPRDTLPWALLGEVLDGGAAMLAEARCTLVGGHSIDDAEPKYGLAVTGLVHPEDVVTNTGARPGDELVLTKPIGSGIVSTAIKRGEAEPGWVDAAVAVMTTLNAGAARAMLDVGVDAATDVTGFGLLGHVAEMLRGTGLAADIDADAVPLLPGAAQLAAAGVVPGGTRRNLKAAGEYTDFGDTAEARRVLLADAQTSGGLLVAVPSEQRAALVERLEREGAPVATRIGRFVASDEERIRVG